MTLKISGQTPLRGEVVLGGSPFSTLLLISTGLLFNKQVELTNVSAAPKILSFLEKLQVFGIKSQWPAPNTCVLDTSNLVNAEAFDVLLLPSLLSRFGEATISISQVTPELRKFYENQGIIFQDCNQLLKLSNPLPKPLSTDGENLLVYSAAAIILATQATEESHLRGIAAAEEISDLIDFFKALGVNIKDDNNLGGITISGLQLPNSVRFEVAPAAMESCFWAAAAVTSGGDLVIKKAPREKMVPFLSKLTALGVHFEFQGGDFRVWRDVGDIYKPISLETAKTQVLYDFLSCILPLLLLAGGESHLLGGSLLARDLNLFNAKVSEDSLFGPALLRGAKVAVPNFDGGLTLLLTALAASGKSELLESEKITDFWVDLPQKLESLHA